MNVMLRSLLQERFKLRTHTDTREGTTYVLVRVQPDKLGPQLWPTTSECGAAIEERTRTGGSILGSFPNAGERPACGSASVRLGGGGAQTNAMSGVPLQSLVSLVTSEVDGPVQNQTGLSGLFDYTLAYISARPIRLPPGVAPPPDSPDDVSPPTLRVALEEQLGLRLESRPGAITVTIIDGIEHPTPD